MKLRHVVFVLALLFVKTSITRAQANPNVANPLPVADWWELQYYQCDPLACESDGGPFFDGSVSTTATGPCFNGFTVNVGVSSTLLGCTQPYFLTSSVSEETTVLAYRTNPRSLMPVYKYFTMDGLSATTSILADDGLVYSTFTEVQWCNGNFTEGIPVIGPC